MEHGLCVESSMAVGIPAVRLCDGGHFEAMTSTSRQDQSESVASRASLPHGGSSLSSRSLGSDKSNGIYPPRPDRRHKPVHGLLLSGHKQKRGIRPFQYWRCLLLPLANTVHSVVGVPES